MNDNKFHFGFKDPLNILDTETQTYGCRANNPDICKYNGVAGICAFVCESHVCKHPSRAWKKQYKKLRNNK